MPYVKQERRDEVDEIVELMIAKGVKADGDLNYILYALCVRSVEPSYNNYKNFRGELRECADEIGRRLLSIYEDEKCKINGDI